MQMNHAAFARSPALRVSLKRGLARQAIAIAERTAPDLPGLWRLAAGLRPNAKALQRLASRIKGHRGVTRVALARDGRGLTLTARAVRQIEARAQGQTVFHETDLIYLRAQVALARGVTTIRLCAVSFCGHALERLVERSDLPLEAALLPRVDAEAQAIFRGWERSALILDEGDEYYPAATPGVWAGGHDEMAPDPDWNLIPDGAPMLPMFSARTFLSPDQMRPAVWLRWRDDPACRIL